MAERLDCGKAGRWGGGAVEWLEIWTVGWLDGGMAERSEGWIVG